MNCCGSHNHNHNKDTEGELGGRKQHSPGGHHGMRWMRLIIFGGLLAYILMYFLRK